MKIELNVEADIAGKAALGLHSAQAARDERGAFVGRVHVP